MLTHQQLLHRVVSTSDKLTFANAVSMLATAANCQNNSGYKQLHERLPPAEMHETSMGLCHPSLPSDRPGGVFAENERTTAGGGGGPLDATVNRDYPAFRWLRSLPLAHG